MTTLTREKLLEGLALWGRFLSGDGCDADSIDWISFCGDHGGEILALALSALRFLEPRAATPEPPVSEDVTRRALADEGALVEMVTTLLGAELRYREVLHKLSQVPDVAARMRAMDNDIANAVPAALDYIENLQISRDHFEKSYEELAASAFKADGEHVPRRGEAVIEGLIDASAAVLTTARALGVVARIAIKQCRPESARNPVKHDWSPLTAATPAEAYECRNCRQLASVSSDGRILPTRQRDGQVLEHTAPCSPIANARGDR